MDKPHNDMRPNWEPLRRAVGIITEGNVEAPHPNETMADFMWMCEEPAGVHHYKHRQTRNYAILRADSSPEECRREMVKAMGWERTWGKTILQSRAVGNG